MKEILFLTIFTIVTTVCVLYYIARLQPTGLEQTSIDNVYKIWESTSLSSVAHDRAYRELERRGYWKQSRQQREILDQETFYKYQ